MTTALMVCGGCARHVRVTEARCPFCGASVEAPAAASLELPRGASRAVIAALGVTLSVGACQSRVGVAPSPPPSRDARPARVEGYVEPHPTIAAPYGAPPEPISPDLPPAVRSLQWFVTVSGRIPMGARATMPLQISATNQSSAAVRPQRERLRLRVNGVPSPAFDLAFNNGVMEPAWAELPAGQTVRDTRTILEALLPAPGEYMLALEWDGHGVSRRSVTVTP